MKPTRRQDLKTNELSQQIEEIRDYAKENAAKLSGIFVVVLIIAVGGYWYYHQHQQRIMDGWASLDRRVTTGGDEVPVSVYESVVAEDLDAALTTQALLTVGSATMAKTMASGPLDPDSATAEELDQARTAYGQVVSRYPQDVTATGQAMLSLGIIAENQDDQETARSWYQKVVDDSRFANYPFRDQASYRLANLNRWAEPVIFPVAMPTVPEPPPEIAASKSPPDAAVTKPPSDFTFILPPSPAEKAAEKAVAEATAAATKDNAPTKPTATTQPAGPSGGTNAP